LLTSKNGFTMFRGHRAQFMQQSGFSPAQ